MTKSQEKAYGSYKNHYMKDKNLIIECETEYEHKGIPRTVTRVPYILVIGVRGGKTHLQKIGGEWKVV